MVLTAAVAVTVAVIVAVVEVVVGTEVLRVEGLLRYALRR